MKIIVNTLAPLLLLLSSALVQADMQSEIQYLLQFVENSGCEFERNGTVYDSKEARSHIERKYEYAKSRVDQTEDFIKYAATESSISGNKYHVTCNGSRKTSASWLHNELSNYRSKQADAAALDQ